MRSLALDVLGGMVVLGVAHGAGWLAWLAARSAVLHGMAWLGPWLN